MYELKFDSFVGSVNGVLVWCGSTFVVLANAQRRYISHPSMHAASKITPEELALEDRRSSLHSRNLLSKLAFFLQREIDCSS